MTIAVDLGRKATKQTKTAITHAEKFLPLELQQNDWSMESGLPCHSVCWMSTGSIQALTITAFIATSVVQI